MAKISKDQVTYHPLPAAYPSAVVMQDGALPLGKLYEATGEIRKWLVSAADLPSFSVESGAYVFEILPEGGLAEGVSLLLHIRVVDGAELSRFFLSRPFLVEAALIPLIWGVRQTGFRSGKLYAPLWKTHLKAMVPDEAHRAIVQALPASADEARVFFNYLTLLKA